MSGCGAAGQPRPAMKRQTRRFGERCARSASGGIQVRARYVPLTARVYSVRPVAGGSDGWTRHVPVGTAEASQKPLSRSEGSTASRPASGRVDTEDTEVTGASASQEQRHRRIGGNRNGEVSVMFSFSKAHIVRAALALAAIASSIVMPFAQPASANQYPPDIQVEPRPGTTRAAVEPWSAAHQQRQGARHLRHLQLRRQHQRRDHGDP